MINRLSPAGIDSELTRSAYAARAAIGHRPSCFHPPGGYTFVRLCA